MNLYDYVVKDWEGRSVSISDYKDKVLLIVNSATNSSLTPQYQGLSELYREYKDRGLEILDFPCNQFLNQAPESIEEIVTFCRNNYNATYRIFSKVNVNGRKAEPLFNYLKDNSQCRLTKSIKQNFTKFLVSKDGKTIIRYEPNIKPQELKGEIERLLIPLS